MDHRYIYWLSEWLGKIQIPGMFAPRGKRKCLNLLVKIFSLKTKKQSQILPAAMEKINFFSKQTVYGSFR